MCNQALDLHDSDCSDIVTIVSDVQHKVEENFAPDSPQRILWDQQMKFNTGAKGQQAMQSVP